MGISIIVITSNSDIELVKLATDLIAQGWHADSDIILNPDGTFSITLSKMPVKRKQSTRSKKSSK